MSDYHLSAITDTITCYLYQLAVLPVVLQFTGRCLLNSCPVALATSGVLVSQVSVTTADEALQMSKLGIAIPGSRIPGSRDPGQFFNPEIPGL